MTTLGEPRTNVTPCLKRPALARSRGRRQISGKVDHNWVHRPKYNITAFMWKSDDAERGVFLMVELAG